jgi:hypothetical protein
MRTFLEKLRDGIMSPFEYQSLQVNSLQLVKQRSMIRKQLTKSKGSGKVLGVYCPIIGNGMFLTGVDDIILADKQETVVLKPYDMNGILLIPNQVPLIAIRSVCPFESFYINPVVKTKGNTFSADNNYLFGF